MILLTLEKIFFPKRIKYKRDLLVKFYEEICENTSVNYYTHVKELKSAGMCLLICEMKTISRREQTTLNKLLNKHRPKDTLYADNGSIAAYWYPMYLAEPRLKFLESLIIRYTI